MDRKQHKIDASGEVLGRLASQIAILLRGKHKVDFQPHLDSGDVVVVKNADKIKLTGEKMEQKKYYRHSGYPGGLKEKPVKEVLEEKPEEVLKRAVYGMLPKNKLRDRIIKRLKFE